ncbi:GldG family protein [Rhodohalobacter sp. 614A]|uniref:GldG family protein n=1 Tax=Rhodohalobacter sp. 614A TaxID=2908649 RepID=UPI001F1C885C|nr:GldG family protein [Rhodohalobacter sp. 614A]
MKIILTTILFFTLSFHAAFSQQMNMPEKMIAVDVAHDPIFWGDPNQTEAFDENRANRVQYLSSQLQENANAIGAEQFYIHDEISADDLEMSDLLFIHVPSSRYSENEVNVIRDFLQNGGSLFLAFDVDGWATLDQTNVNDLISPFGIRFGSDSPDTEVGASSRKGEITNEAFKIPYHGGRIVEGGTPFAFTTGPDEVPFAFFTEIDGGGKLVVMGDAMTPLYMNSWQGVDDYQTEKFMGAVIQWLVDSSR